MFGSDRSRPEDYRRAVVIDTGSKNTTKKETLWSKRRGTLKTPLTEPTLLEIPTCPAALIRQVDYFRGVLSPSLSACPFKGRVAGKSGKF